MEQAESQSAHRQNLEAQTIQGKLRNEARGQVMAFILALVVLIGGFFLIYLNRSVLGTVFIGTDIVALVGVFIYGRQGQQSQLKQKAKETFPSGS